MRKLIFGLAIMLLATSGFGQAVNPLVSRDGDNFPNEIDLDGLLEVDDALALITAIIDWTFSASDIIIDGTSTIDIQNGATLTIDIGTPAVNDVWSSTDVNGLGAWVSLTGLGGVTGTGTTDNLPLWSDGPNGVLADSIIAEILTNAQISITSATPGIQLLDSTASADDFTIFVDGDLMTFGIDADGDGTFEDSRLSMDNNGTILWGSTTLFDTSAEFQMFGGSTGSGNSPIFTVMRSVAPGAASQLGRIRAGGLNQGAFNRSAQITFRADGTWASSGDTTDAPGAIVFETTPDGSDLPVVRYTLDNTGLLSGSDLLLDTSLQVGSSRESLIR